MEISWFVFAIIATLVWSFGAILLKFVRVNYIRSTIGYLVIIAPSAFFSLVFLLFEGFQMPSLKMIIYIVIISISGLIGYWLYLVAIHKEDISRVATLFGIGPLVVLILATIFLGEVLTINDYLAFPLIIVGSMLISVQKVEEHFILSQGMILTFISIVFFSIHALFMKLAVEVNFSTMIVLREAGLMVILVGLFIFSKEVRKRTKEDLKQLNKKKLFLIYAVEIMGVIGLVFSYLAIQRGPVSLVSLVEGTEGLFVIVLAVLLSIFIPKFLKENINKKTIVLKIISALLMIVGLYFIVI